MIEYQDLIADHQALQKQLADQPETVDVERVLRLIAQIRDAGATIGDPQQRDQLRTILRHWWAFVYERTGEYTPTQLAPYKARGLRAWRIPGLAAGATPWWAWAVFGLLALAICALVVWRLSLAYFEAQAQAIQATQVALAQTATAYAEALVTVDPPSKEVAIGATTTVDIRIENVANLYGAEVHLVFNPALLEVVDADSGIEGIQIQPGPLLSPDFIARNDVDQTNGEISFAISQMLPHEPVSGTGVLATITFQAKAAGTSLLDFSTVQPTPPVILSDRNGTAIGTGTRGGSIVVTGGPSPTPPATPTPTPMPTDTPPPPTLTPTFGPTPTPPPGAIRPENVSELRRLVRLTGHEGAVLQVAFSPDGLLLASSGADATVRLWSVPDRKEVARLTGHAGWVQALAFSPDGRWLASGGNDSVVIVWDVNSRQPFAMLLGHKGFIFDVAFSPDSRLLASGSGDGTVRLWDVESGNEVNVIMDGEKAVYGVAFSPDGTRLATANVAGTVREWDTATGAEFCTFSTVALPPLRDGSPKLAALLPSAGSVMGVPPGPILSVAFAPDGRSLAAGNTAGQIIILDSYTCAVQEILEAHTDNVNAVAYSPDGRVLASGSRDTTVKIWPMAPAPITLSGHKDSVEAVAFSPDGRLLASASADGTIILWGLEGP